MRHTVASPAREALNKSPAVIYGQDVRNRYGQDVLYAARGQDVRSRPAKAGIRAPESLTGVIPRFIDSGALPPWTARACGRPAGIATGDRPPLVEADETAGSYLFECLDENWAWGKVDDFEDKTVLENTVLALHGADALPLDN